MKATSETIRKGAILGEQQKGRVIRWKVTGFTKVFGIECFQICRYSPKNDCTFGKTREYPLRAAAHYLLLKP